MPLLSHYAIDLLLNGVDTVADVLVNGKHITQLDNAFRCEEGGCQCQVCARCHTFVHVSTTQGVPHPHQKHATPR